MKNILNFMEETLKPYFQRLKYVTVDVYSVKIKKLKKKITLEDLEKGLKLFCKNDDVSKRIDDDKDNESISKMYL